MPTLRVCRYWYRLILRTPQFWANLLNLSTWKAWNPKNHISRFQGALARSSPESLDLVVPYSDKAIVDVLLPHSSRLYGLLVGSATCDVRHTVRLLEQTTPRLTHLAILHLRTRSSDASTFALDLADHPNIQTLMLEDVALHAPVAPYASLRHLKLTQPKILLPQHAGSVSALCAVHDIVAQFPNLDTLSLIHSLSEGAFHDPRRELPKLTKAVRLPLLRRLELVDLPAYIPLFLSHLVFPAHTALVLELASTARTFSPHETAPIPLFSGINPSPSPSAELSLRLYRREGHHKHAACWETHGAGIRPVCVTLPSYTPLRTTLVARFTRELVAALAPDPSSGNTVPGVTSLTLDPFTCLTDRDWEQLLLELPGLRRLCCLTGRSADTLIEVFGERRLPLGHDRGDREVFLCPGVAELKLGWNIPYGVEEADWDVLRPEDDATSATTGASPSDKSVGGSGGNAGSQRRLAGPLAELCDALRACLAQRAAGNCEPIGTLSVFPHWKDGLYGDHVAEEWQARLVGQRVGHVLGPLVEDVDTLVLNL